MERAQELPTQEVAAGQGVLDAVCAMASVSAWAAAAGAPEGAGVCHYSPRSGAQGPGSVWGLACGQGWPLTLCCASSISCLCPPWHPSGCVCIPFSLDACHSLVTH